MMALFLSIDLAYVTPIRRQRSTSRRHPSAGRRCDLTFVPVVILALMGSAANAQASVREGVAQESRQAMPAPSATVPPSATAPSATIPSVSPPATTPPSAPAPSEAPPAPGSPPPTDATAPPAGPDGAEAQTQTPPPKPPTPLEILLQQLKEARALLKAKKIPEALILLKAAVERADEVALEDLDKADLLDVYGFALHKNGQDVESARQLRKAAALAPKDGAIHMDLADALYRLDKYDETIAAAERALELGLEPDDAKDARSLLKDARLDRLHERLEFLGSVAFAFDSNILENTQYQTIAGKFTAGSLKSQIIADHLPVTRRSTVAALVDDFTQTIPYQNNIRTDYLTPSPSPSQWGLPLNIFLDLFGRVAGSKQVGFWLGYRFEQTFMTYAETDTTGLLPATDTYNFQQHTVTLRLSGTVRWFEYIIRAEGFVNFSGLVQFSPFQIGMNAIVDLTFLEPYKLRTRLILTNNYRTSFDEADDGYLDGNKDVAQLSEELRLKPIRIKLGYQITYDNTGVLTAQSPVSFPIGTNPPEVGSYTYYAPLTYLGNQVFALGRINLGNIFFPKSQYDFFIKLGVHYEYQVYADVYYATYSGISAQLCNQMTPPRCVQTLALPSFNLPGVARKDNQITAELSLNLALPHDFTIALSYVFLDNLSNVANAIDNRTYTKNTVETKVSYTF
jgi:tetratricopeptide (TPR) repeat protein